MPLCSWHAPLSWADAAFSAGFARSKNASAMSRPQLQFRDGAFRVYTATTPNECICPCIWDDEVIFRSPRPDGQPQVYRRKKTSPRRELEMRTREERLQRRETLERRTATQWHGKGSMPKGGGKRIEALLSHLR